jgi:tRNA G18 (ribose-2'-O)-methylase SpoU
LAAIIRTLYYFQVDALILPIYETCSLESRTKLRRDFEEHLNPELRLYETVGAKSIPRMSAGAYELFYKKIVMTKGPAKFIISSMKSSRPCNWQVIACSPPKIGIKSMNLMTDGEEMASLTKHPLIIVFGHEESGIRASVMKEASGT